MKLTSIKYNALAFAAIAVIAITSYAATVKISDDAIQKCEKNCESETKKAGFEAACTAYRTDAERQKCVAEKIQDCKNDCDRILGGFNE